MTLEASHELDQWLIWKCHEFPFNFFHARLLRNISIANTEVLQFSKENQFLTADARECIDEMLVEKNKKNNVTN